MNLSIVFILLSSVWNYVQPTRNYLVHNGLNFESIHQYDCPCENEVFCLSLEEALRRNSSSPHILKYLEKQKKVNVFAFVLRCDSSVWSKFDWNKLTTIALADYYDPHVTCFAHSHGVQVVKLANFPKEQLTDSEARHRWANIQVVDVDFKFMDGINIDFEDAIDDGSNEQKGLTNLVKETAKVLHDSNAKLQLSFDVAWHANGVDGRYYNYTGIAHHSDLIFVMSYDEQSQIWTEPCAAKPNSGIYKTAAGLSTYLRLGIPAEKIILGVPWYGYDYPCEKLDKDGVCHLKKVPFRGCNCSDSAGKERPFSYIIKNRQHYHSNYKWDKISLTPYYTFKEEATGTYHQIRYDDQRSLPYKYMQAVFNKLKGIGMWTINFLDYSDTDEGKEQRDSMFGLLP